MRISDWSSDVCSSDLVQCIISLRFKPLEAGYDYAALSGGVPAARAMHDGDRTRPNRPFHRTPGTAPAQARQPPHDLASCAPLSVPRSDEHTSELQSLMRISYAVFCLTKKTTLNNITITASHI